MRDGRNKLLAQDTLVAIHPFAIANDYLTKSLTAFLSNGPFETAFLSSRPSTWLEASMHTLSMKMYSPDETVIRSSNCEAGVLRSGLNKQIVERRSQKKK
jgi:hypothetical protein